MPGSGGYGGMGACLGVASFLTDADPLSVFCLRRVMLLATDPWASLFLPVSGDACNGGDRVAVHLP